MGGWGWTRGLPGGMVLLNRYFNVRPTVCTCCLKDVEAGNVKGQSVRHVNSSRSCAVSTAIKSCYACLLGEPGHIGCTKEVCGLTPHAFFGPGVGHLLV